MRPVPREGFQKPQRTATNPQHAGWDLRWRKSSNLTTARKTTSLQLKPSSTTFAPASAQHAIRQGSGMESRSKTTTAADQPQRNRLRVVQHAHSLKPVGQGQSVHPKTYQHAAAQEVATVAWVTQPPKNGSAPNYFVDPFNDGKTQATLAPAVPASRAHSRDASPGRLSSGMPLELRPANGLRANVTQFQLPSDSPAAAAVEADKTEQPAEARQANSGTPSEPTLQLAPPVAESPTVPQAVPQAESPAVPTLPLPLPDQSSAPATEPKATEPKATASPSLGEIIKQQAPDDSEKKPTEAPALPKAPSDPESVPPTKSFSDRLRSSDQNDRDRLNRGQVRPRRFGSGEDVVEDLPFSCQDFRKRIASQTIDQVSLDISPPYRPDEMDDDRYQLLKEKFDEKQTIRTWHDRDGNAILTGRLRDLAYERAVIETNSGTEDALPINQLSEGDIAYIAENWGLPKECLIEQVAYAPRKWTPSTMTWKASNLCHNPLYFQDVNLERYGHTRGPVLEPVVQSAHFFANIAILPYKMGVHCPRECQYALGYYRPGNCAPWIKPPVPISARGTISQAATMTGLFWLIP